MRKYRCETLDIICELLESGEEEDKNGSML